MFGLGGAWGWIEPDSDGMADATVTFCGHGQGFNGAFHENLDVSWSIVTGSELGDRFVVGTDPTDQYIVFDETSDLGFIAFSGHSEPLLDLLRSGDHRARHRRVDALTAEAPRESHRAPYLRSVPTSVRLQLAATREGPIGEGAFDPARPEDVPRSSSQAVSGP